ncbi:MAG: hypothetical protein M3P48_01140 [Actinomycetota bacterium]|nr:hypothetical protein [Actinomycetota bacterium]
MSRDFMAATVAGLVTALALLWGLWLVGEDWTSQLGYVTVAAAVLLAVGPPLLLTGRTRSVRAVAAVGLLLATVVAAAGAALLGIAYPFELDIWRRCRMQAGGDCGGRPSPVPWLVSTVVLVVALVATWVLTSRAIRLSRPRRD